MIEIKNVFKSFNGNKVLKGIALEIPRGKTFAIIGKSGCGKSVLLKLIVGLLRPDAGSIIVDGRKIEELNKEDLFRVRRKFGFLFQSSALFDSMTVEENVALPVVENNYNLNRNEIKKLVAEKLELVGLPGIEKLKPSDLSGGMKKRVGLARALITNPEYILYDEPTTGLDPIMSDSIDDLIKDLSERLKVTSVLVTHDLISVKKVAHHVAMIHEGKIFASGKPQDLLNSSSEVISNFIKRTERK